ncbi:chromosome segregation protein SMC [Desulfonema magnum]|uniref:Chromosome partition protein Smc n=1 Tax=Desulfonema magnum TaxID=45655 RepID=A0A975BQ61_9BACT|nr:chromosome segregation protein SMC [Desulfonema magnum]QTA89616.1 Chromosome partition protein [Desulfonema magnum]
MKLKKLQITGFKSFCDKSSIQFPPGICAVVGPNGCGKSNIVDALRWAMGEQSVKQLRGKSMEDVIFAGTNGRPPLNMAEVSLVLENDNGSAPEELKDFTEIMITRRLYRSGESAYLINKQPCRLKDITNIFLGSGMGAKSYAVIQQGNIGAITDAGPDERRFFIEEAAGITRYKQRKKEALRKVDATNQNLLRVKDVITEVERQMNSVKRQAKKAEQYKTYQEHIKKLDVLLALHYYDDYTRQLEETSALLRELKDSDIQHVSKIKQLDAAVEDIKLKRWQKNEEISAQKASKFETQRNVDKLENDLAHLHKDVERLSGEAEELRSAHKELEEKNENITSEVAQTETEHIGLKEKTEEIKSVLSKERRDSESIRERLANLNQELETCKTNLMNLVAQEAKYKNIYQNASNNKDSLKRRLKRTDEEEAVAGKKVAEYQKKETEAREELELCRQEIEELKQEISTTRSQLDEKSKALGEHVRLVQSLELERTRAKSKYSTLKKMEDNFEWYKGGVKAIMQLETGNSDIMGLMADIIEPEASFETPLEAVLGESLQYILIKNQETGVEAIDYLQSKGAGRSGFIPVSSVRTENSKLETRNSDRLLNHVSIKGGFEKIAEALLGHVLVTENMQEALELSNNNGRFHTFVTKNGDMISHEGFMVGGSQENLSGILAKKHELRALEGQVAALDEKLESDRGKQKHIESEVRTIESDLQKLIEQKNRTTEDETEAERDFYKVTEELKHARRHLEMVRIEQEQLADEENGIDEEIEKYNKVLAEVENDVKAGQTQVAETSEKISSVSAEMEAFNQKIVDLKLELTTLNARLENSNNSLRRLKQFWEDGITRLGQLTRDIELKEQKQVSSKEKITEYEQTLSAMYETMKSLEQTLESNEADYEAIDARLRENDSSISEIKNKREDILQKIRMLEIEQSQRQIKRENVANQVEERYQQQLSQFRPELVGKDKPQISADQMEAELSDYRKKLSKIGDVNLGAIEEYGQLRERFDFLCEQRDDLLKAVDDLHKVIRKINKITQEQFLKTFDLVNEKMAEVFPRLFDGGSAKLILTDPNKPLETGVEFMVHPPGKKLTRLSLLSGGEKALSAIAFIFSIFLIKPASFCIMDEIDAPLDEANVFRFNELLRIIGEQSQIIVITHKKKTMEFADTLFGITMEKKGVSKIVSVNFDKK